MLHLQQFLLDHPTDWKALLTAPPYALEVREKDDLVLFAYNQIESKFDYPLVCEARGIILERDNWIHVVAMAYQKFWNQGERLAASIDWATARVQEKIDGSILKCFYHKGEWRLSSMSMIDAHECTLQNDLCKEYKTFWDLFQVAAVQAGLNIGTLNKGYTYVFELCSQYNRVVVPHKDIKIYHTGTRDNETLQELDVDIGVPKPREFKFSSMEETLEMAKTLPFNEEGYVVVDGSWNRVKIKSPAYLVIHRMSNNGRTNKKRALELILLQEHHEFLIYYNEYKPFFDEIEAVVKDYVARVYADIDAVAKMTFTTKKDYALHVKGLTNPGIMFLLWDKRVTRDTWYKQWVENTQTDNVMKALKLKSEE